MGKLLLFVCGQLLGAVGEFILSGDAQGDPPEWRSFGSQPNNGGLTMRSLLQIVYVAAAVAIACSSARVAEKTMPINFVGDWCYSSLEKNTTWYTLPRRARGEIVAADHRQIAGGAVAAGGIGT